MATESSRESIVIIECAKESRESLLQAAQQAGYQAFATGSGAEGLAAVREKKADLVLLDADLAGADCRALLAELKGAAATEGVRVILLTAGGAKERVLALDLGADDALSRPWEANELLARIRAQLRARRAEADLREKARIAEEGQQIAHTAFQALAVTEKMTRDAFSLDRALKIGLGALFLVAAVIVGVFFLYSHRAETENRRAYATIARLEGSLAHQQDLIAEARKLREQFTSSAANGQAGIEKQLAATQARLRQVERESQAAESIIRADAPSVCLLHLAVAFRHKQSGQRLRYGGINPQGQPLQDSEGNPIFTLEGRGPEVRLDVFGTGFLAASGGRILTNRHVAEPWWKDEQMGSIAQQGFDPEIAEIHAYFPEAPNSFPAEIRKISQDADLAVVHVDLGGLKRAILPLDSTRAAAVSGQPVISMGYATGLAAILARTDEETVQQIVNRSNGNPTQVLAELAQHNLIRPVATQGHIGDVLPDKIVFDAQTTSGGSGGPLFNQQGKVVGVTYAVIRGFGGSNFGIPIRYAEELLVP
jgi:DNA-binding response OmpR family regulator/S1-C subfamily serine protease